MENIYPNRPRTKPAQTKAVFIVSGHFDSRASDVMDATSDAPGADEDGSCTVLRMELARVFAQGRIDFDATIVFMAFAGEEQGLIGAQAHAQRAEAEKLPIEAVFNNDMVGNPVGGDDLADTSSVRVFSEGPEDSPARELARYIQRWGARYVPSQAIRLIATHDRSGRGGPHQSCKQHSLADVRPTAERQYASTTDTL